MQMKSMAAVALATSGLITSIAAGDAVEWRVADGGNGHWYQRETNGMNWDAARAFSQARGGDLVSLEAAGEWQWVSANVPGSFYLVGGYQRADATSVSEGWIWLTGSPISGFQTNFDDNPCGFGSAVEDHQQDYIEMVGAVIGDINSGLVGSCTDDGARPFLVEWSADCNNDGIVDYGQIKRGELPDFNGNNIPDCCEQGTACTVVQPAIEWRVADGGNGHWYQLIHNGSYLCWSDANDRAIALGATLVSETSIAEHNFIAAQFISRDDAWSGRWGPWIGAHLVNGAWSWTTGESWSFSAWYPGEPNGHGAEPVASYIALGEGGGCGRTTTWNDWVNCAQVQSSGCEVGVWNYIVEWSADCNNDGIVDYGQCRDGSLPDFNGNNIPDCCEQGTACAVGSYPVEWRVSEGGNGHWYRLAVPTGGSLPWGTARDNAAAAGGYLATLTSSAESDFAFSVSQFAGGWQVTNATPQYCVGPWLGGSQPPDAIEPTGGWRWGNGEPWSWTNWWAPSNEPNDGCGGGEDYLSWLSQGSASPSPWWNDSAFPGNCGIPSPNSYVIEWSSDCNSDGIVDYGQILNGELADANDNGVPDICEQTPCPGDIAADGVVNGVDLAAVLNNWGTTGGALGADANGDGVVDGADLALVLNSWGPCPK